MAKLCEKCFHCSVCSSARNSKIADLIDSNGCVQFVVNPGTQVFVKIKDSDDLIPFEVDYVIAYKDGTYDVRCINEQGLCYAFTNDDVGSVVFFSKENSQ